MGGGRAFGGNRNRSRKKPAYSATFYPAFDDGKPPDAEYFRELARVSRQRIIWGGNFFLDYLSATDCLIVWDKKRRGMDQADCEIAWTNLKNQSRVLDFKWNGMLQENMRNKEERIHLTQKPIALYEWLLSRFAKPGDKILDTHVGSASSLIACHRAGLMYWGFEIDPEYYRLATERMNKETAQVSFVDIAPETQTQLFIGDK